MEDFIELKLKNDKALLNEQIVSLKAFPIKISENENKEISVIYFLNGNEKLYDKFMTCLSEFVIKRYEKKLLKRIILTKWNDFFEFQLFDVLEKIAEIDDDEYIGYNKRLSTVKKELYEYFELDRRGRLTGLVQFRLPEYIDILEKCAERLVELFYTQREYEEFIGLLKYFVSVQGERPRLVHLYVHKQGMYTVLDENNEDITEECIEDFGGTDEIPKENFDDLLISVLITLAPEKIIVHNRENIKNKELFDTIKKVFEKVEYII